MKRALLLLLALAVLGGTGAALTLYRRTTEPYKGYEAAERFVIIEPGSGTRAIGRSLVEAGVIRSETIFRAALWTSGRARSLQAGEFRFDAPMTPVEVIEKIATGDVYARRVTFPEGLNITEMARIYEQQGFGPAATFVASARDPSAVRDLDPDAPDLEGYLFPETYLMPRDVSAARLVGMMVGRFRELFTPETPGGRPCARTIGASDRDARVARRERDRHAGRAVVSRGGLSQPLEGRHGNAGRPDGHLRAAARGPLRRQFAARRSVV